MSNKSPKKIYSDILAEVDKLIASFENKEKDEELKKAQNDALKQLKASQKEIQDSIRELERNAEWDTFTMAFYGETNAGKSTLIETLRILLKESDKKVERQKFNQLFKMYNESRKDIEKHEKFIKTGKDKYSVDNIDIELQAIDDQLKKNSIEIEHLKRLINEQEKDIEAKKNGSFIDRVRYMMKKLPSQEKEKEYRANLKQKEKDRDTIKIRQDDLYGKKEKKIERYEQELEVHRNARTQAIAKAKKCSEELTKYSDGQIIGDGRSDFTPEVCEYAFKYKKQNFAFLDLPGIQGRKGRLKAIKNAVQRAHAVFYVTDTTTPLQAGETDVEGTLEKINKHLGQQTEVFTIYNKRANNPETLKEGLVNEGEKSSLRVLDRTMRKYLGRQQYQGSIQLSAYPAFLSVANCWQNNHVKPKLKFKKHFGSTLMEKTEVDTFVSKLTNDIVKDCKAKIKKSNFRKAVIVLNHTVERIKLIKEEFIEVKKKVDECRKDAAAQLDDSMARLVNRLDSESREAVDHFKENVRKKIYADIDDDIKNAYFRAALEEHYNNCVNNLQRSLVKKFNKAKDDFEDDVFDIVRKYQKNFSDLLKDYNEAIKIKFDKKFNFNLKLKSGINWPVLVASIIGAIVDAIFFLSNPLGWIAGAGFILGSIFSMRDILKSLGGFLDHKIRKDQQKKSANKFIKEMEIKIRNSIKKEVLDKTNVELKSRINNTKRELAKTVARVKIYGTILEDAELKLANLARAKKAEGSR